MSVITAITAQNTQGVLAVQDVAPEMIEKQMQAIFEDIKVDAVKIGMVSRIAAIETIAAALVKYRAANIVVDPVMVSKSGYPLLQPEAESKLTALLLPLADLATPNIPEAEVITGRKIASLADMEEAARRIHGLGAKHVLLKGGHRLGDATDVLFDGRKIRHLTSPRLASSNTHGTGCTLSAAIAAGLARGLAMTEAVAAAKDYVTAAIQHSFPLGKGVGPTHHFYTIYQKAGVFQDE